MTELKPEQWIEQTFSEFKKDPFVDDNHIHPQSEFILSKEHLFKLEDDGVPKALETVSPSTEGDYPAIEKLKSIRKAPAILEGFKTAKNRIREFYAKDYEVLGYPDPG